MPRDVSLSDSKCWNGGHEWVKPTPFIRSWWNLLCVFFSSFLVCIFLKFLKVNPPLSPKLVPPIFNQVSFVWSQRNLCLFYSSFPIGFFNFSKILKIHHCSLPLWNGSMEYYFPNLKHFPTVGLQWHSMFVIFGIFLGIFHHFYRKNVFFPPRRTGLPKFFIPSFKFNPATADIGRRPFYPT